VTSAFAAVDLGASSGRVMVGTVEDGRVRLDEVHRFANVPVRVDGVLTWDVEALFDGMLDGLRIASHRSPNSIGIDGWAIDFALLDESGNLLGRPVHYRDEHIACGVPRVHAAVAPSLLHARTGIQFLPFNTVYQLASHLESPELGAASTLLLIPDLFVYWLTGKVGAERTNASTTQLLDARSRTWATDLMERIGIPTTLFPTLIDPGTTLGQVRPALLDRIQMRAPVPVTTVASHDTASAVAAVPARDDRFAYIATGTWSLAGVELSQPILDDDSRTANFSNELGVDGTVRFLRNVMGLWVLQESLRSWAAAGTRVDLEDLLSRAAHAPPLAAVVDIDDPVFVAPGDMPERIAQMCRRTGQPAPQDPVATVRCVVDSLALAHARAVGEAIRLSGRDVDVVHIVGGGARNALLCQATADACGLPVEAGPVEAAAFGNVLLQARAANALQGGLATLRDAVRRSMSLRRYEPTPDRSAWVSASARVGQRLP
jgi:rhamnulokinase